VTLWSEVAPEDRSALFAPPRAAERLRLLRAAAVEPALEVSLTTLAALVGNPAGASSEIVTLVCLQVSRWAQEQGAPNTSLAFAQAGALASPEMRRRLLPWGTGTPLPPPSARGDVAAPHHRPGAAAARLVFVRAGRGWSSGACRPGAAPPRRPGAH
jgi:hypothetical protein